MTAARYPWPSGQKSAAVLSFDFDAESGFLFREPEQAKRSLGDLEERRFGPRVGVDRILRLMDRLKRKYGPALADVIAHAETCREQLAALQSSDQRAVEVAALLLAAEGECRRHAEQLSEARRAAATRGAAA